MAIPASADRPDLFKVWLGLPPRSLIQFPPANPPTLPPPAVEHSWLQPFTVPTDLFHASLDAKVPLTIATVYAVSVILMNRVNKSRNNKPWAFSKTRLFKLFVILHNVFLAVYSAWTFIGMTRAFRASLPGAGEKPLLVNTVDALCKINGPRGLGNAAVYDPNSEQWTMLNPEYQLTDGTPDPMDVGRLWNSGLAFFGWLFYLSKFYEVLDTVIILAKGKKSSTLQTYHHAGAMMCMWAGIRFMAAPIWIFAIFNSLIHALMYTYYTLTAVRIRVPNRIKRSLTTMQIIQFLIGCSLAAVHLFIYYSIPVAVPHNVALRPNAPTPSLAAGAANDSDSLAWLKKLALRAAGAQGVAENVANSNGSLFGVDGAQAVQAALDHQEIRYTLESRTFSCMSTTGQTFAVWLNVLYLLPLTFLFVRFFVQSYLRRASPTIKNPGQGMTAEKAEKAGMDALKGVTREIRNAVNEMHGGNETETASGSTTDADVPSGTTTPNHPDAYEACINTIMTKQQRQVERRASVPEKHPVGVKYAEAVDQPRSTATPSDVPGAKSYSDALQTDPQTGDVIHPEPEQPFSKPAPTSSSTGVSTPSDPSAYESIITRILTPGQKAVDDDLQKVQTIPQHIAYATTEGENNAEGEAPSGGAGGGGKKKKKRGRKA